MIPKPEDQRDEIVHQGESKELMFDIVTGYESQNGLDVRLRVKEQGKLDSDGEIDGRSESNAVGSDEDKDVGVCMGRSEGRGLTTGSTFWSLSVPHTEWKPAGSTQRSCAHDGP